MAQARRAFRYTAALLLGFVGTLAIGEAARFGEHVRPNNQPVRVADPDVFGYCTATRGTESTAALVNAGPNGWRCASVFGGLFKMDEVDMNDVCRLQFGPNAFARPASESSASTWQCWTVRSA